MSKSKKILSLTFGEGINVVLNFFLLPFLSRSFEVEKFGTYSQNLMIVGFAVSFLAMGFNQIVLKELSQQEGKNKVVVTNLITVAILGLIGMIILYAGAQYLSFYFSNSGLSDLILIYALSVPFQLLASSCNSILVFEHKVKVIVWMGVIINILRLLSVFIIIRWFDGALTLIFWILTFLSLLNFIILYYNISPALKFGTFDQKTFKNMMLQGVPLGITFMISAVYYTMDGFMVSSMLGVEKFALYRNGAIYIPMIMNFVTAINTVLLADVSAKFINREWKEVSQIKKKANTISAGLIYPVVIFFIVFSKTLITLYLSERYMESGLVFAIFNGILLFRINNTDDIFIISNNSKFLPFYYAISCLVNFILNIVLIKIFGVNGAALASLLAFLFLFLVLTLKSVSIIECTIWDILDVLNISKIWTSSVLISIIFYGLYTVWPISVLPLIMLPIYLSIVYYILLKRRLLDTQLVKNILISFFGAGRLSAIYEKNFTTI